MEFRESAATSPASQVARARTGSRGFQVLIVFRNALTTAAIWAFVGVPVAALLSIVGVISIFTGLSPTMLVTGAALGAVQGLWLTIGGRLANAEQSESNWTGVLSGALLGLLGFPPVFSHMKSFSEERLVVLLVVAVACGGMISGVASVRAVAAYGPWGPPTRVRNAVTGCVLLLALTVTDYRLYWGRTLERLPALPLTHAAVANIGSGDSRGSQWSGCYAYEARDGFSANPETGLLVVQETDGTLTASDGSPQDLRGGVDRNGHFRLGMDQSLDSANHGAAVRILWDGWFSGDSATFSRRTTLSGSQYEFNRRFNGTAKRTRCPERGRTAACSGAERGGVAGSVTDATAGGR
jgi:hypothetical protein